MNTLTDFNLTCDQLLTSTTSGVAVVYEHGRMRLAIQRDKTATSDNIVYEDLLRGLIDFDCVIPQWEV